MIYVPKACLYSVPNVNAIITHLVGKQRCINAIDKGRKHQRAHRPYRTLAPERLKALLKSVPSFESRTNCCHSRTFSSSHRRR
jgi:hypothetical protein